MLKIFFPAIFFYKIYNSSVFYSAVYSTSSTRAAIRTHYVHRASRYSSICSLLHSSLSPFCATSKFFTLVTFSFVVAFYFTATLLIMFSLSARLVQRSRNIVDAHFKPTTRTGRGGTMNKLFVICTPLQIGLVSSSRDSASISKLLSCVFAFPLKNLLNKVRTPTFTLSTFVLRFIPF